MIAKDFIVVGDEKVLEDFIALLFCSTVGFCLWEWGRRWALLKWHFSPLGVIGSTVSGIVNVSTHLKLLLTKGVGSYKIISLFTRCDKDILQR